MRNLFWSFDGAIIAWFEMNEIGGLFLRCRWFVCGLLRSTLQTKSRRIDTSWARVAHGFNHKNVGNLVNDIATRLRTKKC